MIELITPKTPPAVEAASVMPEPTSSPAPSVISAPVSVTAVTTVLIERIFSATHWPTPEKSAGFSGSISM